MLPPTAPTPAASPRPGTAAAAVIAMCRRFLSSMDRLVESWRESAAVRSKLEITRGEAWPCMVKIGFFLNGMMVALSLLLPVLDSSVELRGINEVFLATLPSLAPWGFCALYLAMLSSEDDSPLGPAHHSVAYVMSMAVILISSIVHPSALGCCPTVVNRFLFSIANLHTGAAMLLNTPMALALLASEGHRDGRAADQDFIAFVFREVCTTFWVVAATYCVREMCKASILQPLRSTSRSMEDAMLACEDAAVRQMLNAKFDTLVFVDAELRITRPSPGLALMLGQSPATGMLDCPLPVGPASSEETQRFMDALRQPEPGAEANVAGTINVSLMSSESNWIRFECVYSALPGQDGHDSAGYLLGISELPLAEESSPETPRCWTTQHADQHKSRSQEMQSPSESQTSSATLSEYDSQTGRSYGQRVGASQGIAGSAAQKCRPRTVDVLPRINDNSIENCGSPSCWPRTVDVSPRNNDNSIENCGSPSGGLYQSRTSSSSRTSFPFARAASAQRAAATQGGVSGGQSRSSPLNSYRVHPGLGLSAMGPGPQQRSPQQRSPANQMLQRLSTTASQRMIRESSQWPAFGGRVGRSASTASALRLGRTIDMQELFSIVTSEMERHEEP